MATVTCRSAPRLLTCLRSTTTLRPHARTPTPAPRTITSFQGLQGLVQPWNAANIEAQEEEETEPEMSLHMEALQRWQKEAQQMREMRILPDALARGQVNFSSDEEVQDLMQTLVDEDLLDIRRGWVATTNY